jgi:hypothetical protein
LLPSFEAEESQKSKDFESVPKRWRSIISQVNQWDWGHPYRQIVRRRRASWTLLKRRDNSPQAGQRRDSSGKGRDCDRSSVCRSNSDGMKVPLARFHHDGRTYTPSTSNLEIFWKRVQNQVFDTRVVPTMDRVFLTIILAGIILLVAALALTTPGPDLPAAVQQRILHR